MSQETAGVLVPPRPTSGLSHGPKSRRDGNCPWPLDSWHPPCCLPPSGCSSGVAPARRRAIPTPLQAAIADDSPPSQLLNLAGQVRETLAIRFGPAILARTTEELSADPVVKEALGDDHFQSLIRLLSTADHWKFASPPANGQSEVLLEELPRWSAWERIFRGAGRA